MKTAFKRVLSFLLAATLVFGTVGAEISGVDFADIFSFQAEAATYSGTFGDNLTWSLNTSTGVLDITGTGAMWKTYTFSSVPWSSYLSSIKIVNIADGVTTIGRSAFSGCDSLTSVTIPDTVTIIGESAFWVCRSLESVTIPNGVITIEQQAFENCDSLKSITIPASVTTIGMRAVAYNDSLESITVDENNEYFSSDKCGVLFNKNKTELIQYPIGNARTNYEIPYGVNKIGEYSFDGCAGLTTVTIPDSVTIIDDSAFSDCNNLTGVTIPDSVITINDYAFIYCDALTSVTIGEQVSQIGTWVFMGCQKLPYITVDKDNASFSNDESGTLFNKDKTELIQYPAGNSRTIYTIPDSVTTIAKYAFYNCDNIISVVIPDSVTTINSRVFEGCDSLKNVIIPDSVTSIGNSAFYSCDSLEYVHIPASVTSIGSGILNYTSAYICSDTEDCYAKTYADNNSIEFKLCDGHGVEKLLTKIEVKTMPTKTEYFVGDTLDTTGLTLTATFSDGSTETIDSGFTCSPTKLNTAGKQTITVTYGGKTCTFDVTVEPADEIVSGQCGDNLTWTLNITKGVLNITGTGAMINWSSYSRVPWYSYRSSIKTVNIASGVTTIGGFAFNSCSSLISVTIPDSVTYIDYKAFYGCDSLTSVTIPDSVTYIGSSAFGGCDSLTSITIPDSVTTIGDRAFCSCDSLTSIAVDENNKYYSSDSYGVLFNKDKTTLIQYPIGNARTSYTIPDSVTTIGNYAFCDCDSLTSVTIPDSVTSIGKNAFEDCDSLTSVTIPDSVTSIGDSVFRDCDSLTSITIGNSVTTIGFEAFRSCDKLISVTIPDSVTAINNYVFVSCNSLEYVHIPASVTSIGLDILSYSSAYICSDTEDCYAKTYADENDIEFKLCGTEHTRKVVASGECGDNLTWTLYDDGLLDITGTGAMWNYTSSSNAPWYDYRSSIKTVNIADGVTTIGNRAFYGCDSLTSVTIPDSVTTIGSYAFYNCDSLTSVTIPDSVTTIGDSAFCYCYSLISVTIPDSVTTIGDYALAYCNSLESITIPDSVTSIGDYAFAHCDSLTSVTVDVNNKNYSSDSYGVLFNKDKTTLIQYPVGNTRTSYTIPDSVTSIRTSAFYSCDSLTSVTIGNSVTSIGGSAFSNCYSLTSVTIPDSVTTIGGWAFAFCDSLEYVHIPASVISIGSSILISTSAYICSDTEDCYAKTYADENSIEFRLCDGHGIEKVLTGISVKTPPTKTEYFVGDTLDTTGLTLTATYSDGSTETVDSGFTCSPTTLSFAGNQSITVTYAGKTCTFSVKVIETEYKATFMANGSVYAKYTVTAGEPIPRPVKAPEQYGKVFAGWADSEGNIIPNSTPMPYEDLTLYATWKNESYSLTVNFLDSDGNKIAESYSKKHEYGSSYSVTCPDVYGYSTNNKQITGTMPGEDTVIDIYYSRNEHTLSFIAFGKVIDSYSFYCGDRIDIVFTAPEYTGYTFTDMPDIPGVMPDEDVEIVLEYEANEYNLRIDYVYSDGSQAAPSVIDTVKYGENFSYTSPEVEGFTPNFDVVSGIMDAEDFYLRVTYTVNGYSVYIKAGGRTVAVYAFEYGDKIDLSDLVIPEVEGYTYTGMSDYPDTMPANDIFVYLNYEQNKHNLNISYVYYGGGKAAEPVSKVIGYGESYSVASPAISGYIAEPATVSGTMGDEDINVEVVYKTVASVTYDANGASGNVPTQPDVAQGDIITVQGPGDLYKIYAENIGDEARLPIDVVLVLDSSGSMTSNDRRNLRLQAAREYCNSISDVDRVAIVDFDDSVTLLSDFTNDKTALANAVNRIDSSGGTDIGKGISKAIDLFDALENTDEQRTKIIVLLTDGDGYYVSTLTAKAASKDITVFTIGLGNGVKESLLKSIAEGTNGQYFWLSSANELPALFDIIRQKTVTIRYEFLGWLASNESGEIGVFEEGDKLTVESDTVLKAIWGEPDKMYVVEWVVGSKSFKKVYDVNAIPVFDGSTDLPDDGYVYTFLGWDADGNGTVDYLPGDEFPPVTARTTYVAVYHTERIYVTGIEIDTATLRLYVGEKAKLNANVIPATASEKAVIWSSADSKIASVDASGTVTANAVGSVIITATSVEGGFKAICRVTVVEDMLETISVETLPDKTEYFVGDTLDTTGLTLKASYASGRTKIITSGFTCSPTKLNTAGKQTVTVSYGGKACIFDVTVKAVELVKIEVKTLPTKTEYFVGDTLDTTGLTLTATYNNGTTETVTTGFTCTPTKLNTAGKQTITVSYGGKTCTFDVTVKAVELVKIEVKTLPTKTEYFVGDTLNITGLTLTATYNNGTTETIATGFTCSPTKLNTAGKQTITVTYGGKTCTFDVTVKAVELVKIEVKTMPTKTEYFVGDTLNTAGLTLTATYNNGTTETVTSGFTCSPTKLNTAGKQTITVSYGGKTCTFQVTVKAVELVKIEIKTMPTKTEYFVGDTLDTAGLTLTATYNNGTTETITSGFTCSPTKLTTAGKQTITVSYGGKTCIFDVTVKAVELVKIEVKTLPTKTEYFVGDTLDTTGLTLIATYNNGTTETITSGFTCSPTKLTTAGKQTITVTYGGKTCTFDVEVEQKDYSVTYMVNGKRYAKYIVTVGDPVPAPAVNPIVDGMIFEGWSPEIVQLMPANDLVYTAVFHKHVYTGSIAIHPTCTQHGVMLYTCSCGDSYNEIIPALGHDWGNWITVVEATPSSNGQKVRYCSRCGTAEYDVIPAPSANFRVEQIADQEYTGFGLYPAVKVYSLSGKRLDEYDHYEVSYENNIDCGVATATVKGVGEYSGVIEVKFNIVKKNIAKLSFAEIPDVTYSGDAYTPDPVIYYGDILLVKDVDYTVSYSANVNIGKATITITGIGNYTGTKVIYFNISKNSTSFSVPVVGSQVYTGKAVTPDFNLFSGDKLLIKGVDYTVTYENNINVGYGRIIINGIGNYSGTIVVIFRIVSTQISLATVPSFSDISYDGNEFTPDFKANPITYGGKKLVEGVDFKVEIYNNRNAGTVKIVIIGIGNFTGTIVIYVNINAVDISSVTVSRIDDVEYNGAAQTPSFRVTKNGKTLVKGVDYTVEYRNNIFVGTATVVIKGIGNYRGEKRFTFRIVEPTYYELTLTTESETLGYDSTMQVWAEISPYPVMNCTFIYESSNSKIASVNEYGVVKALDEGEVIITVTVVDEDGNAVLNPDGEEIRSEIRIRCTMTFWQKIIKFFRSIAAFFTNLFTFSIGLQMQ